jgi:hypothetical protein
MKPRDLALLPLAVALIPVLTVSTLASAGSAHSAVPTKNVKNVNIVGAWQTSIFLKQKANGDCTGTTTYGAGYGMTDCKVTGNKVHFVVTYTGGYRSTNNAVVTGNTLTGHFHDTNGTSEDYTATRTTHVPTSTTITCTPAKHAAACKVTVRYNNTGDELGAATGRVKVTGSKARAASCSLKASKTADVATCKVTAKARSKKSGKLALKAAYAGSKTFRSSHHTLTAKVKK